MGTLSQNEGTLGSGASLSLFLSVTYDKPESITADNNFTASNGSHGSILVDGNSYSAPYSFTKYDETSVTLQAVSPQTDNQGYQEIWNTGSCDQSRWSVQGSFRSNSQAYILWVSPTDNGATYLANFHKNHATTSGTMSSNETWIANETLSGDVTIPSGVTLNITSCSSVNLNGHSIISTGGTINNQGSITGIAAYLHANSSVTGICGTVQAACSAAPSSGASVEVQSGQFNGSLNINNKVLELYGKGVNNTTIGGEIYFNNCSGGQLHDLSSDYVELNNCYNIVTWQLKINNGDGCYCYNSTDLDLTLTANGYEEGLGLNYYSNASVNSNSQFENHTDQGVAVTYLSNAIISSTTFCSNTLDIWAGTDSWVDAASADNVFSSNPAPVSGNVSLPTNYGTCGMAKSSAYASSKNMEKVTYGPMYNKFNGLIRSYFGLSKEVRNDTKRTGKFDRTKYIGRYNSLVDSMKTFLQDDPGSDYSPNMFSTIVSCYKKVNDYDGMRSFLEKVQTDKNLESLNGVSKRFMIDYYINNKQYDKALSIADEILNDKSSNSDLLCDVTYAKGLIYQYSLDKNNEAQKCYSNILNNYPDNNLAKAAKRHLSDMGIEVKEKTSQASESTGAKLSSGNYPNPFNPTTTITYTLPEDGVVTIKVFNTLGQEIKTLINGYSNKGSHSVMWDGNNNSGQQVTSGIYFYNVTFKGNALVKKMLMIK